MPLEIILIKITLAEQKMESGRCMQTSPVCHCEFSTPGKLWAVSTVLTLQSLSRSAAQLSSAAHEAPAPPDALLRV